ncbi:MAG TPA: ParB/RepB/Spo0J family partition protein [Aquabacterium sp.]|nr:ParB/RepB/Spo0J family partition protein [Aquabacterium sp.]
MKDYSAETGAALADEDQTIKAFAHAVVTPATRTPSPGTFATIALDRITPSLTNPRKTFDPAKLQDLAESIRSSGVHQPVVVRSLPGSRLADTDRTVQYELVVGERRLRASIIAGVDTIPAIVRTLSDNEVLEIQVIENLQRDDLAPLEEAEGYDHLMQHTGLSADEVAAKIGKSRSYVYAKLKLLDLCQEVRQALREGSIDASRALLIARIPDGKLQLKALSVATAPQGGAADAPGVRAFGQWLQQNVMLRLEGAPFPITDARLTAAGSCKDCPKRTGANPDLFSDVAGADVCTDPACYHLKEAAHHAHLVQQAQAKGMKVLAGADAKAVVTHQWDRDALDGYTRLDSQRHDATGAPTSLRNLLTGVDLIASGIQPVLIEHPRSKELIEAVPTHETEALLITKGLLRQSQKAESVERQIDQLKASMERNVFRRSRGAMWTELVKAVHASTAPVTPSADLVRAWLVNQCDHLQDDDLIAAFTLPDLEDRYDLEDRARLAAQRIPSVELWKAVVILMMAEDQAPTYLMTKTDSELKKDPPHFTAVAQMLGMDLKPIELEARATVKAEVNEEIKALKAQIAPKPKAAPATTPAAGVDVSTGGKGAKAKKADAPLRKPKTSASEAQAQIAAAMQAEEKTDPGADAQGIEATASGFALAVGARVKVLPSATGRKEAPWIGKKGTVSGRVGPEAWDVTFEGKVAKPITGKAVVAVQSFHVTELEMVE